MPLKREYSSEYTVGGTRVNLYENSQSMSRQRRFNPMIFLTICCGFFVLAIVGSLIVFTFLPIFSKVQGNQMKYQIQSEVLTLIYNLPDRLAITPMNWTYATIELDENKLSILQDLLQYQLNTKKMTRKTSLTIIDANIIRQTSPSTNLFVVSPISVDHQKKTVIIITQPDIDTQVNATNQLVISLMLRYALECTKRCRNDLKESIFAKTFHSLEIPVDTFQLLFTNDLQLSTDSLQISCVIATPPSTFRSSPVTARSYEAESPLNQFVSSMIESCSMCSNGQKVSRIGFTNELIFQPITSSYGGLTTIVLYYTTDRMRYAEINVNNRSFSMNISFPAMVVHKNIATLSLRLNLCQGLNTIRISNPTDYAPDIDRMIVY